jgi:hypothetical protein
LPNAARALLTAFTIIVATPALSRDVYECSFPTVASNMGYLPDLVIVAHDPGSDTVTVVDAYIQDEKGGPIDVPIAEENDAKLSVSWQLMLQSVTNDYVKMYYRVSIQKRSLAASFSGRPQGYSNSFTAQGKCKRIKG